MRVAFIGQKGIPALSGGVERHVEELASRLSHMGVEVTVYCRSTYMMQPYEKYKGVKLKTIKTVNNKNLDAIVYILRATRDSIRSGYDILHYHGIGPASLLLIPYLLKMRVIATVHGLDWKREKWGRFARAYLKFGEMITGRYADKIISVSQELDKYFIEKYKRTCSDVLYIPNGVNIEDSSSPEEIERYGLKKDGYILFLARLVPEKGAHYLIKAYKSLAACKKLVIAGGSSFTQSYETSLKELAGDNPNIIFTGDIHGNLLNEIYSNCYFYVLPSEIEGMPLTLLEALSHDKCCLVSDIPENSNLIRDGKYGYLFKSGNIDDLKDKLKLLFDNPEEVNKKTGISKAYIEREYDWQRVADMTYEVYKSCLKA